jgi:hypothetical protein
MVITRRRALGLAMLLVITATLFGCRTRPDATPSPSTAESTPKHVAVATWHACDEFEKAFKSGELDTRQGRLAAVKRIEVWTSEEENSDAIRHAGIDLKRSIEDPVRDERWIEAADAFRTACREAGVPSW